MELGQPLGDGDPAVWLDSEKGRRVGTECTNIVVEKISDEW